MDQDFPGGNQAGNGYAIGGKIMLSAIIILFAVVIFMAAVHLYARWYFLRQRRRRLESRLGRGSRAHIVMYAENQRGGAAGNCGLGKEVIDSLPSCDYSTAVASLPECAVCLQDFEGNDVVRMLPNCRHCFHIECIDMWFGSHSTCPLCRTPVEPTAKTDESTMAVVVEVAEEEGTQPEQSSGSDSASCQHQHEATSLSGRRKTDAGLRIEVSPARRAELEIDLSQSSPGSRFLYLKRLLSMSIKSPIGSAGGSSHGAGTSAAAAAAEMDIEAGHRVQTPR